MKEKNKKLWLELYSIVDKILKLEPWQKLTDNNLLMYISNKKMMYIIFYLIPQYFFSSAVVPWLSPSSALSHLCTLLNISFLALSKFSGLVIRVKTTR